MVQAFHHGEEINRAEALAAPLSFSWAAGDKLLDSHICGGLQHLQDRHEPSVAIPRLVSALQLSDAPFAWKHLGGAVQGSGILVVVGSLRGALLKLWSSETSTASNNQSSRCSTSFSIVSCEEAGVTSTCVDEDSSIFFPAVRVIGGPLNCSCRR